MGLLTWHSLEQLLPRQSRHKLYRLHIPSKYLFSYLSWLYNTHNCNGLAKPKENLRACPSTAEIFGFGSLTCFWVGNLSTPLLGLTTKPTGQDSSHQHDFQIQMKLLQLKCRGCPSCVHVGRSWEILINLDTSGMYSHHSAFSWERS